MKLSKLTGMALAVLLTMPGLAFATNTVLSGVFTGGENRMDPLPGSCGEGGPLGYQDAGTFQVAADGRYRITDAFDFNGVDVTALVYAGPFDPADPMNNLLTPGGVDSYGRVDLLASADYRLVVQQWCENKEGAWAITFSGPGNVISDKSRSVPAFTEGLLTDDNPVATTDCASDSPYLESGPIQVAVSGTYYYTDMRGVWYQGIVEDGDVDACLQVYSAPFNPDDPSAGRIGGILDDTGSIDLAAGTDYYFVVQSYQPFSTSDETGEYFFVLAPPAPFRIHKALAGGWFNPATSGQGFFIDVYDNRNQMFVGWYTFDLTRPVNGTAQLGEPGHRWLTAYGTIDGAVGNLDVYLAEGGAFDAVSPPINSPQTVVGSITFEFEDCMTGTADYALTTPQVSGTIPIQPLADDHVELCNALTKQPGNPGPL